MLTGSFADYWKLAAMRATGPLLLLGLSWAVAVHADSILFGVASRCDPAGGSFTLAPVIEMSTPDPAAPQVTAGFRRLPYGDHQLQCRLPGTEVQALVRVAGPGQGHCMGTGYVSIERLRVGDLEIYSSFQPFNWKCDSEPMVTRVTVLSGKTGPSVEICTAEDWELGVGYVENKCATRRSGAYNAGFDCNKATSKVERLICSDRSLSEMDRSLSEAFAKAAKASNDPSALRAEQRQWLRTKRDACSDATCLSAVYKQRISELDARTQEKPSSR